LAIARRFAPGSKSTLCVIATPTRYVSRESPRNHPTRSTKDDLGESVMAQVSLRAKTQNLWQSPKVSYWRHMVSPNRMYRYLTAERRCWPDFIIAGAQKSGTTSLYRYLETHPNMRPPITKELAFFDRGFGRGTQWYRLHFPLGTNDRSGEIASEKTFTGESTAYYIFHPLAPQRIAETLPRVKVIVLLRNPIDRAFSHYQHKWRRGQETLSFDEAIDAEEDRLAGEEEKICNIPGYRSQAHVLYSYLTRGKYLAQLRRWQKHFSPDRLLVLESGSFFKQTAEVYQRVLEFLGVPSWRPDEFGKHFAGGYKAKMSDATRRRLIDYFAPHNQQLYAHLGTRFDWDR
jgi:hypothetical protein